MESEIRVYVDGEEELFYYLSWRLKEDAVAARKGNLEKLGS